MSKTVKQFLLLVTLLTLAGFGPLLLMDMNFYEVLHSLPGVALFTLGCLAPTLAAILIYCLTPGLGGLKGLWQHARVHTSPKAWFLVPFFLLLHYGLSAVLGIAGAFGSPLLLLRYGPMMLLLFGCQELGWRLILFPELEARKGFWKAAVSTGLFLSIWFFPLLLIPGFLVRADFFLQFAGYMVGLSMLQSTIRRQGGSILACGVFTGLFFALSAVVSLHQTNILIGIAAVDVIIAVFYNSRLMKENSPAPM